MLEHISEFISKLVRPTLAFVFAGGIVWGFIEGKITGEAFLSVAGTVIAFYVGTKSPENAPVTVVGDRRQPVVAGNETVNVTTPRRRAKPNAE